MKPSSQIINQKVESLLVGARPPAVGSEKGSAVFREVAHAPVMGRSEISLESIKPKIMSPSPKPSETAGFETRERGFEPEGSADITPPFSESNSNNSTPAYVRWAENLNNLLGDPDGVELYKNYLNTENCGELLDFWFACQGLKKLPLDNREKIFQLVKVINRKFLRSKVVPILEGTRKEIQDKIAAKDDVHQDIFDAAQVEVEERMTRTTYRNFLASEAYLNYVQNMQIGESDYSAKCSGSHSTSSSVSGKGVLHDDSGHFSVPLEGERNKMGPRVLPVSSLHVPTHLNVQADTTSDSTSGISEGSSHLTPMKGHNTTAYNNTSIEELEPCLQMVQSMSALPTLHEHSELDLTDDRPMSASFLGLTSQSLMMTQRRRHAVKPEAQAGIYLQSNRVPAPYHAYNSAYNPVSRQDSELQSLSSDAHTTDDNMSSFTESSSHYSYRQITSKKHIRRQLRKAHEQSRHNRENTQTSHSQQAFIPRTARVPPEATNQLPPAEFAKILTQKLEKVKREQESNEKLNRKLASEDSRSIISQDSSRSIANILGENVSLQVLPEPDLEESDQSILDQHVLRIWKDKTPLRSPGDPAGRPLSPGGGYRRGKPQAMSSSLGPMQPHRTLPGRGNRSQARRVSGHQVYHQDLAYYEVDRVTGRQSVGGVRGEPVRPGVGVRVEPGRPGDGNTSRVMEWMQEVARHAGQPDQKSQSSRGANKTSPRSSRPKPAHRSQSQERMSTSWAGHHPGQPQYQYQPQQPTPMQLEEAKRRLMMVGHNSTHLGHNSTHMGVPPQQQQLSHSNNSTLRKSSATTGTEFTVAVYTFSHEREPMPYRIKIPSRAVTLKAVKDLLPKKGVFRFYFKTEVDGEACYEEETEDTSLVPLWEGKVLVQCRIME